jgi:hypothetical protein
MDKLVRQFEFKVLMMPEITTEFAVVEELNVAGKDGWEPCHFYALPIGGSRSAVGITIPWSGAPLSWNGRLGYFYA